MDKCSGIQECVACGQVNRNCFICKKNTASGEIVGVYLQPRFLFWTDLIKRMNIFYKTYEMLI